MDHVTTLCADCQSRAPFREEIPEADFSELPAPQFETAEPESRLIDAVRTALRGTGHSHLRELEVEICRGVVVLWGRVPTYYQKQLAQVTAQQVHGVHGIANGLEVVCVPRRPSTVDES
jgi:hypothetical protein